ncbi:MAG: lysine--tRNA ligase, partial [Acidobacteria bacterium]|nr:lysine--tRNA ligase [Acidobacteriota bacterium]
MSELDDQIQNRREKRRQLLEAGIPPYPNRYPHDLEPSAVQAAYGEKTAEELEAAALVLRVPGRLKALRRHGKIFFLDLVDGAHKLQVMVRRNELSETATAVLEQLDLGDYVGASGKLLRSRTGELTLFADDLVLLSKALRPLPEKWHGLSDLESRYRQRYLDLLVNPETRRVFEARAAIVRTLRAALDRHGFLEVETPMMQKLAGGAAARPFVTHHNALDIDLYLRVAPELFLKRLLVGGLHKV